MDKSFRSLVERIRESNDIVEIVSEHIALDRSHKALCPMRKRPRAHVNRRASISNALAAELRATFQVH